MSDLIRVRDLDTGHERTIRKHLITHGNYKELSEPAVDPKGEPLPAKFATTKPAEVAAPSGGVKETGHKATNKIKES